MPRKSVSNCENAHGFCGFYDLHIDILQFINSFFHFKNTLHEILCNFAINDVWYK